MALVTNDRERGQFVYGSSAHQVSPNAHLRVIAALDYAHRADVTTVDGSLRPLCLDWAPSLMVHHERCTRRVALIVVAGLVAGLAYCSWPLGFLVNPALVSRGLASDLEVAGQPYNWLFVSLDCITGLATLAVASAAWRRRSPGLTMRVMLVTYALFGVVTSIDALIPTDCPRRGMAGCGANLTNLNLDDVLTGVAIFSLFACAVAGQISMTRRTKASWATLSLLVAWSSCGTVFFANHFSAHPAVALQHLLLVMTSVVAISSAWIVERQVHQELASSDRTR